MSELSGRLIDEYKTIMEEEYGMEYSYQEAKSQAEKLVSFANLILEIQKKTPEFEEVQKNMYNLES